jgi:hypothetical protein
VRCALIATTGGIWLGLFSSEEINSPFSANKRERFLIQIKGFPHIFSASRLMSSEYLAHTECPLLAHSGHRLDEG